METVQEKLTVTIRR